MFNKVKESWRQLVGEPTRVGPFTMLPGTLQQIQEAHAALALRVVKLELQAQALVADTRKEIQRLEGLIPSLVDLATRVSTVEEIVVKLLRRLEALENARE